MKMITKRTGLIAAALIAISFNSHFAQAAKSTVESVAPQRAYAFKKTDQGYVQLPQVEASEVIVKTTGVSIDRDSVYIGGYVVNTTDKQVRHVRIYPVFSSKTAETFKLADSLNHDELLLEPKETRRFVIKRSASDLASLIKGNLPLERNCILSCKIVES